MQVVDLLKDIVFGKKAIATISRSRMNYIRFTVAAMRALAPDSIDNALATPSALD